MIEFEEFLDKVGDLDERELEKLADELARNPEMAPPDFGAEGLDGVIRQLFQTAEAGQSIDPAQESPALSPLTQPQNPGTPPGALAGNMSLGDVIAGSQGPMPDVAAQAPQGAVDPAKLAGLLPALQGPQTPEAPRVGNPFIGNLALGGGTQMQNPFQQQQPAGLTPGLAQYLLGLQR